MIGNAEFDEAVAQVGFLMELVQDSVELARDLALNDGAEQLLLRREIAIERGLRAADSLR